MTHTNPRNLAPASLHGLRFDPTLRAVVDEFAALRLHDPSITDYATFARNPPSTVTIVDRARHHAEEAARFFALVQNTDRATVDLNLGQLYGLVQLNLIATVAVAIMPAHTGADRYARRQQGGAFLATLDDPTENELRHLGDIAYGLQDLDAASITQDAIAYASRHHGAPPPASQATMHVIEEQVTLRQWLHRTPDLPGLLEDARHHADMATCCTASLERDPLAPHDRDELAAAHEGALLQHVLALAAIALSQVHIDTTLVLDAADPAVTARPPVHAALLIAIAAGQHFRAMIAAHPY